MFANPILLSSVITSILFPAVAVAVFKVCPVFLSFNTNFVRLVNPFEPLKLNNDPSENAKTYLLLLFAAAFPLTPENHSPQVPLATPSKFKLAFEFFITFLFENLNFLI